MAWFEYSENQMVRETLSGYEFIQAIWLDKCPYDSNREYCVIQTEIEFNDEVTDLESASNYFDEYCINDSHVVKEDCSKEEAAEKVKDGIREGLFDPPENCSDSWCETEEMEDE